MYQLRKGKTFRTAVAVLVDGVATNADALPTAANVLKNLADSAADSFTVVDLTAIETGLYGITFTPDFPSVDDRYTLVFEATVSSSVKTLVVNIEITPDVVDANVTQVLTEALLETSAGNIGQNFAAFFDNNDNAPTDAIVDALDLMGTIANTGNADLFKFNATKQTVSVVSNRPEPGLIQVTRGVDYKTGSIAGAIELPISQSIDLTGATFSWTVTNISDGTTAITKTPTISGAGTENQKLVVELDDTDTSGLALGALYEYVYLVTESGGNKWKPEHGTFDLGGDTRT